MTITASGDIAATDLIAEFGGTGMLSEYYRDGGLVPSERAGYWTYSGTTAYMYGVFDPIYRWKKLVSSGNFTELWWNNAEISSGGTIAAPGIYGFYYYEVGPSQGVFSGFEYFSVRRSLAVYTDPVSINTSVPTSDDISLTDFYSATAS